MAEGISHPSMYSRPEGPAYQQLRTSCDSCKKLKIRCQRESDSCVRCIARHERCTTTMTIRKPPRPNRRDKLDDMETRIRRMESLLSAAGLENSEPSIEDAPTPTTGDELSTLITNDAGGSVFIGSSSGLSLFSPSGLRWISETTGTSELSYFISQNLKSRVTTISNKTPDPWRPVLPSDLEPIPMKSKADIYVDHFFASLNTVIPLYEEASFRKLYDRHYSADPPTSAEWYASLNTVLAIGSLMAGQKEEAKEIMPNTDDISQNVSWRYFRNACSVFTDLLFKSRNLLAVQALIGMAFVQDLFLDGEAAYTLIGTAARLSSCLGLHRKLDSADLSPEDVSTRRNVFWVLYVFESILSLRLGRQSAMDESDIEIDLPDDNAASTPSGEESHLSLFTLHVKLTKIENMIFTNLFSSRARMHSRLKCLQLIGDFDKKLQAWRDSLPASIQPDRTIRCSTECVHHVIMLHFSYYNCVIMLHRSSVYNAMGVGDKSRTDIPTGHDTDVHPQAYASHLICLYAARNTANLLNYFDLESQMPRDNLMRHTLYYSLSAFLLLFVNCLQNPYDSYISSDIRLLGLVTNFLSPALRESPIPMARFVLEVFTKMKEVVEQYVALMQRVHPRKAKRVRDDPEQLTSLASSEPRHDATMVSEPAAPYTATPFDPSLEATLYTATHPFDPADFRPMQFPEPVRVPGAGLLQTALEYPGNPFALENGEPWMPLLPWSLEWEVPDVWYHDHGVSDPILDNNASHN